MRLSVDQIARLVGGRLSGRRTIQITGANILRDAREGEITLADNVLLAQHLAESAASAVVVPHDFRPQGIPFIAVDNPRESFARIVAHFRPPRELSRIGVSSRAHVSSSATIGEDVDVHPGATIGDDVQVGAGSTIHGGVQIMAGSKLGHNVTIFPNAVLYENTFVGPGTTIHASAVLGAYGFGYETADGRHERCAQLGYTEIGADVEIGACSTIDRGTFGATVIGEGTKIDNQVMIAHNCRIGRHNIICSQVGVAGSVTTGDYVVMAGQVGIRDHVQIGDWAVLSAKAGVSADIPANTAVLGSPAVPESDHKRRLACFAKLPEMRKQLKKLQQAVDSMAGNHERQEAA